MANLINSNQKLPSNASGYIEASYSNEFVDAGIILQALNGPEGNAAGVVFTGINTPIGNPISGTRQISFVVDGYHTPNASVISSATYDQLNQVPGISDVSMGNVYSGELPISVSSVVNTLLGQQSGSTNNTNLYLIIAAIIIILIMIAVVEKNL